MKKRNVTSEHLTCHQETLLPNNVYSAVFKKKKKKINSNVGPKISILIANTEGFVKWKMAFVLLIPSLTPPTSPFNLSPVGSAGSLCVCVFVWVGNTPSWLRWKPMRDTPMNDGSDLNRNGLQIGRRNIK